jgi:hypothetical protein
MAMAGKTSVDLTLGEGSVQCPNITVTIDELTVE